MSVPRLPANLVNILRPYAEVLDFYSGGKFGNLKFVSDQDYYSTAGIAMATAAVIPANSNVRLFEVNNGQAGQGFTANHTVSETNNENGDEQPVNEIYCAFGVGFEFYFTENAASLGPLPIIDARSVGLIGRGLTWQSKVGNGPTRDMGYLAQYPHGGGVWASGGASPRALATSVGVGSINNIDATAQNGGPLMVMRRFQSPFIFPPLTKVVLRIMSGTAITLRGSSTGGGAQWGMVAADMLAIRAVFRGVRLTAAA